MDDFLKLVKESGLLMEFVEPYDTEEAELMYMVRRLKTKSSTNNKYLNKKQKLHILNNNKKAP